MDAALHDAKEGLILPAPCLLALLGPGVGAGDRLLHHGPFRRIGRALVKGHHDVGAYRSQLNSMIKQAGGKPLSTDYSTWVARHRQVNRRAPRASSHGRDPGILRANRAAAPSAAKFRGAVATFLTMAYILFVNPSILAGARAMPRDSAVACTALAAAICCILMGLIANFPMALASGMGLNAIVAFTLAKEPARWQAAMGVIVLDGLVIARCWCWPACAKR